MLFQTLTECLLVADSLPYSERCNFSVQNAGGSYLFCGQICPTAASSKLGNNSSKSAQRKLGRFLASGKSWSSLPLLFPTCLQQKVHGIAIKCCFLGDFVLSGAWERDFPDVSEMYIILSALQSTSFWGKRIFPEDEEPQPLGLVPNTIAETHRRHSLVFGSFQCRPTLRFSLLTLKSRL